MTRGAILSMTPDEDRRMNNFCDGTKVAVLLLIVFISGTLIGMDMRHGVGTRGAADFYFQRNKPATKHWHPQPCAVPSKMEANISCPRFTSVKIGNAGLGDRFLFLMVLMSFALDTAGMVFAHHTCLDTINPILTYT